MKLEKIIQKRIEQLNRRGYKDVENYVNNGWHKELSYRAKLFEESGFILDDIFWSKHALRIKYPEYEYDKGQLAKDIIKIFPDVFELHFSQRGIYIK